jgi:hypothetical protein
MVKPRNCVRAIRAAAFASIGLVAMGGCQSPSVRGKQVEAFDSTLEWREPTSLSADRMKATAEQDDADLYRAEWTRQGSRMLVVLEKNPLTTFGQWWHVKVLDETGKVWRSGEVHCWERMTPYCLLEVRTENEALPETYRNQWVLAIGSVRDGDQHKVDVQKPFRFYAGQGWTNVDQSANWINVEPVEWDEDVSSIRRGVGILDGAPCLCRPAENSLQHVMSEAQVSRACTECDSAAPSSQP